MKHGNIFFAFIIAIFLIIYGCATVPKNPLIEAVSKGDSMTVQKLVKEGAKINDIDSNGITPLMHAVYSDNIEIVKTLLSLGANVNQRNKLGEGAVYYATYNGSHNMLKLLFLASRAMEGGSIQEVTKICNNFQEDVVRKNRPFYESYLNYRYLNPKINYKGNKKISVIVRDQRKYILSKEKNADYVGLFRAGFGRPYDIGTLSSQTLADDIAYCVTAVLNDVGFIKGLAYSDRIIEIDIQEWMTDTSVGHKTGIYYDVTAKIFDGKNNLVARTDIKGMDNLGGNSSNSLYNVIPEATETIIGKILNEPDVMSALKDSQ